jgi:tRNA A-37 threonylcarbamoyl transferase component Bud32
VFLIAFTQDFMDSTGSKSLGRGESECTFSSHVVHTSGAVLHSPAQNQEVKPESCNLSNMSSSELDKDISSDELIPSVVEQLYSGKAPEHLWTALLSPRDRSPTPLAETVNEEEHLGLVRLIHPSELEIVRQITQGGQARIFLAKYLGTDVVVKRYKCSGVGELELHRQKELVLKLQRELEKVMKASEGQVKSRLCPVIGVSMDNKGKILVVMQLMEGDLRTLIDSDKGSMRFGSDLVKISIMREIAIGIRELHSCGRIHKDIKASNILVGMKVDNGPHGFDKEVEIKIGDYESSDDVVGTGFWRAPEVLQAVRDRSSDLRLVYSPAVDVYGFGMVCYEILMGQIPFEGHPKSDYDLVLSGKRPDIPDHVDPNLRDLLHRCWHDDPLQRPGWPEILDILHRQKSAVGSKSVAGSAVEGTNLMPADDDVAQRVEAFLANMRNRIRLQREEALLRQQRGEE